MAESKVSTETWQLIEQLSQLTFQRLGSWWPLRKKSNDEVRIALIRRIAEQREPIAAAWLFPCALERSTEMATAAAKAMKQLLLHATAEEVLWLERRQSWCDGEWLHPDGRALETDLKSLKCPPEDQPAVWALATLNWSGHVRETAIKNLISTKEVFPIPFVLLRLNDWVREVREAAKRFVCRRIDDGRFEQLAQHLLLVCRLDECGRDDHSDLVRSIVGYALARPSQFELSALLNGPQALSRRVFRVASEIAGPHQERLAEIALSCCDMTIRLQAVQRLPELVADEVRLRQKLNELAQSHLTSIRRATLSVICQRFPDEAEHQLLDALFDESAPIRELAQFTLRKFGINDLAERYRSALSCEQTLVGALSGLGQTGTRDDAFLIQPLLNSPISRVRKAAVTALGRLLGDNAVEQLLPMLNDHSTKVGQAALAFLSQRTHLVPAARLGTMFVSSLEHSQILIVELLDKMNLWASMPYSLRIIASGSEAIARRACDLLVGRLDRVFTTPTSEQRQQLESLLDDKSPSLPQDLVARLRDWLKYRLATS